MGLIAVPRTSALYSGVELDKFDQTKSGDEFEDKIASKLETLLVTKICSDPDKLEISPRSRSFTCHHEIYKAVPSRYIIIEVMSVCHDFKNSRAIQWLVCTLNFRNTSQE